MSRYQLQVIFEYPHLGQDVVSATPPRLDAASESGGGPAPSRDPDVFPYRNDTDTDTNDEDELQDDESKMGFYRYQITEVPWRSLALHFLNQIPQSDAEWSRHLSCNNHVRSLCHRLKIPSPYSGFQAHLDWSRLFDECTLHLARAHSDPSLASLFSLVFVAACHVALYDGCPRETVLKGLRACLKQCGVAEQELTRPMLDRNSRLSRKRDPFACTKLSADVPALQFFLCVLHQR
ncbi:hypothetical protein FHETE_2663 [Fusarium heterosporum]|uniref:Uncharacterized protein n=1 Tax=Fusarium heterosporum TaxID=42747 RepID=A0A8H5WTH6_FUSHE|nr:hypothetical protein FHETE_2663 [Fusarium heterosporum]